MLGVALNVPVMYPPDWAPPRVMKELADVEDELRRLDFHVWYDGAELRKPVVLAQAEGAYVLRRIKFDGLNVRARGYFFAQHGTLRPQELQGILIRIRHAAVGEYDRTLLGFPSSLGPLFQRWMSAEILADDRLEDALNIDRRTLRTTAPEYVELQAFLHEQLQNFLSEIRDVIYARGRSKREERRIEDESDRINEILENRALALPPSARNQMRETLVGAVKSEDGGRLVRRKYSPSDLLELTLSVAHETLDARAYRKFAVALAERLTE